MTDKTTFAELEGHKLELIVMCQECRRRVVLDDAQPALRNQPIFNQWFRCHPFVEGRRCRGLGLPMLPPRPYFKRQHRQRPRQSHCRRLQCQHQAPASRSRSILGGTSRNGGWVASSESVTASVERVSASVGWQCAVGQREHLAEDGLQLLGTARR